MARELQWSASGRTAHGAHDDTSGGCEAFKDPRDDVRYGHGGRYGHAASCQALIPKHHSDEIVYEAYGFSGDHKQ
jgi:hypothetical protein